MRAALRLNVATGAVGGWAAVYREGTRWKIDARARHGVRGRLCWRSVGYVEVVVISSSSVGRQTHSLTRHNLLESNATHTDLRCPPRCVADAAVNTEMPEASGL